MAKLIIGPSDDDNNQSYLENSQVTPEKESLGSKFANAFISESAKDIGSYILFEWLIPDFKNGLSNFFDYVLFGRTRAKRYSSDYGRDFNDLRQSNVMYRQYYQSGYNPAYDRRDPRPVPTARRYSGRYERVDYRNIIIRDEIAAYKIVDGMHQKIKSYGRASKANLYQLIREHADYDIPITNTDFDFGWFDIADIGLVHYPEGYWLDLKEAVDFSEAGA